LSKANWRARSLLPWVLAIGVLAPRRLIDGSIVVSDCLAQSLEDFARDTRQREPFDVVVDRHDDAGGDDVTIVVDPNLDLLQSRRDDSALLAVFHVFDAYHHMASSSRVTFSCASAVPVIEVCPRGRVSLIPQWWRICRLDGFCSLK
jgi:hypothetical protein